MNREKWNNPSNIIALIAIFLSTVVLIISVNYNRKTIEITKTHNEKSVKPIVQVNSQSTVSGSNFEAHFQNSGLGTALIDSVNYYFNNKKFNSAMQLYSEINAIRPIQGKFHADYVLAGNILNLSANKSISLFRFSVSPEHFKSWLNYFSSNKIVVVYYYKDIYDNKFEGGVTVLNQL